MELSPLCPAGPVYYILFSNPHLNTTQQGHNENAKVTVWLSQEQLSYDYYTNKNATQQTR